MDFLTIYQPCSNLFIPQFPPYKPTEGVRQRERAPAPSQKYFPLS
jgi:hypothetical protein